MPEVQTPIANLGRTNLFERVAVVVIVVFPVMGVFFAPETYLAPPTFSLGPATQTDVGFGVGRLGYILTALWLIPQYMRFPGAMARALWRSLLPISFGVWMIVTGFWSPDPVASVKVTIRIFLLILFAVYLIERFDWSELVRLLTLSAAIGIIASILAIIFIPTYASGAFAGDEGSWRGAFINKNTLGAVMTLSFVIGCYSLLISSAGRTRLMGLFVIGGSVFMIAISRSATAAVGVMFAVVLTCLVELMRKLDSPLKKLLVVMLAGILVCLFILLLSTINDIFGLVGRDATLTGRTNVWRIVIIMIEQNPIWGYGADFWSIDSPYRNYIWNYLQWATPHAHNSVLDIWFQLGIVGLAISIATVALCLWRTLRFLHRGMPAAVAIWSVMIIVIVLRGLVETLVVPPGVEMFWISLAFAGLGRAAQQRAKVSHRRFIRSNADTRVAVPLLGRHNSQIQVSS